MKLYDEDIPVFETAESMLKFIGLYEPTQHTLEEDLVAKGLSRLLIDELITVRETQSTKSALLYWTFLFVV